MNEVLEFATSSRKIKSHVAESQINHRIIFNVSISKFYQCSIRGISMFFSICFGKKNPEGIKFLGILKKYVSENKTNFCSKTKNNVLLNNKINEKRSQEYQSMDPEYVTGQINGRILELLLRRFFCLIFAPSRIS